VSILPSKPQLSKKAGDVLLRAGVLKHEQYEAALAYMAQTNERFEEAILNLGILSEADMLKALAGAYKTRFVSTEKLAKAEINRATLAMIPKKVAESLLVFPVMFDPKTHSLSVVTADPDNVELLQQLQITSGAKDLKAFLARPAAIKAVIAKAYSGDIHAFALLDRQAHAQFHQMLETYDRNVISDESIAQSLVEAPTKSRERVMSEKDIVDASKKPNGPMLPSGGVTAEAVHEVLNVLVSLLENGRQELRGHSAQVGRLMKRVAERINLSKEVTNALITSAYLHDLGKQGQYHLTALNCSEWEGHKLAGQKTVFTPTRLLEAVKLPEDATNAVNLMYERYDGKGFPNGVAGKDIPLGARVLAVCDTYADLTQNPRNPYRKQLSPADACAVLAQHKDKIFDPHLVDLFRGMVLGEDLRARLLANRYMALIVDADPEESTVLELRMTEQGFEVRTARSFDQALKLLSAADIDLVVSEIDLPQNDGLALLAEARKQTWGKDVPWVVHTRQQGRAEAQKAFELGVTDFVVKGSSTDVLVAKLKALLDQRATKGARGVSGNLREMGLPELVQVLSQGRKGGKLKIRAGNDLGEIHFAEGEVVNALWSKLRGEEAFYAMLKLQDGDFGLDPGFKPQGRVITANAESLLLEGMRRMDEEGRDA
jgi:response regulator RpfG family c-di-GMP phosphodiesterase